MDAINMLIDLIDKYSHKETDDIFIGTIIGSRRLITTPADPSTDSGRIGAYVAPAIEPYRLAAHVEEIIPDD
jgi:hypothetical protein